jgi:gliding motility-associated-like protein
VIPIRQNLFPPIAKISSTGSLTCLVSEINLSNQSSTGIPANVPYPRSQPVIGYRWEGPTPQQPEDKKSTYTAFTLGIYTLQALDLNNGCTSFTTIEVGENRAYPVLNNPKAPPTPVLDCGSQFALATVYVTGGTGPYDYSWAFDPGIPIKGPTNQPTLNPMQVGEFKVKVTDRTSGCSQQTIVTVVNGALTPAFEPDRLTGFAPLTVTFDNRAHSSLDSINVKTTWNFGNGTSKNYTSTATDPVVVYTQPGTYTVTQYAAKGNCLEMTSKVIVVENPSSMVIPNIFTPNNDGVNDLFILQRSTNLTSITAEIFDRWGHKVYEVKSDKSQIEWDGTTLYGKDAPEGTYYYIIKATGKDGQDFDRKGIITLVR